MFKSVIFFVEHNKENFVVGAMHETDIMYLNINGDKLCSIQQKNIVRKNNNKRHRKNNIIRERYGGDTFQVTPKNGPFLGHFSALFFGLAKLSRQYNGDFASKKAPKMTQKMGFKIFTNRRYRP